MIKLFKSKVRGVSGGGELSEVPIQGVSFQGGSLKTCHWKAFRHVYWILR